VSDSLDDRLRKTSEEVRDLEQQFDKFNRDNALRLTMGTLPPPRIAEGQDLQSRLYEARQRQTSLLLESISASSNRLEGATSNLQKTSESQVKVAESQVKVTESLVSVSETQARTMKDLLRSSHRLEQFTIYLIIFSALNIFIVEYVSGLTNSTYGLFAWVGMIGAITAMMAIAARWLWLIRKKDG
jgi:hypothetical protein